MKRRYREILSIILNTDGYITGNELAKHCNVSIRTIRLDIKEINILLIEYDIKIDSLLKKGYFLSDESKKILKENNIIRSVLDYQYIMETPGSPFDRQMFILSKLTNNEDVILDELVDMLYVSSSTLNNDILSIKKWLKEKLNLKIKHNLSKGIKLIGNEAEKRNVISWILCNKLNISNISKYWKYIFDEIEFVTDYNRLFYIIDNITKKHGYYLSGHSSQFFSLEILISIHRFNLNYILKETKELNHELLPVIKELKEEVERYFNINLSSLEWLYLQKYFSAKQFLYGTDINKIKTDEAICIRNEFFGVLREKYNINLLAQEEFSEKILLYLSPMIKRLKCRYAIASPIDKSVAENYKLEFKMAGELSCILKKQLKVDINKVELAYLTVHLASVSGISREKLNTMIVSDFDESIITFIRERIVNNFSEKLKIVGCYTYQQFKFEEKEKIETIDFIITTSTLADITDIPFVQVNPVLSQKDNLSLNEYLYNSRKFTH